MLRFIEFLIESLSSKKVHHNTTVNTIKSIAKNGRYHEARFVIDKDDNLHGADAYNFYHNDMVPEKEQKVLGFVKYRPATNEFIHDSFDYTGESMISSTSHHPIVTQSFPKYGIKNNRYSNGNLK